MDDSRGGTVCRRSALAAFACAGLLRPRRLLAGADEYAFRKRVQAIIDQASAADVGVAYRSLPTGDALFIHADHVFHAASTMKVPVMMEVYRQAHAGRFSLDDRMTVRNDFVSIADGSHYALDPKDDSELDLYTREGEREAIRALVHLMITKSSNLATNLLIDRVSAARVTEFMRSLGAPHVKVLRGVEDGKAYAQGMNNTVTARGLAHLLEQLSLRKVVSPEDSSAMIDVMLGQTFHEGIPAGLPGGTRVAHKTGWFKGVYHDAAIVYPQAAPVYVLVVLTRGIAEDERAHRLVADIARLAHAQAAS